MITPILLSGGIGSRLWPISRKSFPKQFSNLLDDKSPFQDTVLRFNNSSSIKFHDPIILTNNEYRFLVVEQLQTINLKSNQIIIEPELKDTAAAIMAGTLYLHHKDPNSIILVSPTDHLIVNLDKFYEADLIYV